MSDQTIYSVLTFDARGRRAAEGVAPAVAAGGDLYDKDADLVNWAVTDYADPGAITQTFSQDEIASGNTAISEDYISAAQVVYDLFEDGDDKFSKPYAQLTQEEREELVEYARDRVSNIEDNLTTALLTKLDLNNASPEQFLALHYLMESRRNVDFDLGSVRRMAVGILTDPISIGVGVASWFGLSKVPVLRGAGAQATAAGQTTLRAAIANGVRQYGARAVASGAIEGAFYTGVLNESEQAIRTQNYRLDDFSWSENAAMMGTGAAFGGVLGGGFVVGAPIAGRVARPIGTHVISPVWRASRQGASEVRSRVGSRFGTFMTARADRAAASATRNAGADATREAAEDTARRGADAGVTAREAPSMATRAGADPYTPSAFSRFAAKVPFFGDAYFMLRNLPTYAGRGFSWQKSYRDYTRSLYAKFDALKQNSAVNHLLNINAGLAEDGIERNFVAKGADGKPMFDTRGAMRELGEAISEQDGSIARSTRAHVDNLSGLNTDLAGIAESLRSMDTAQSVMDVLSRKAQNTQRVADAAISNRTYSQADAIAYLRAMSRDVGEAVSEATGREANPDRARILQTEGADRINELAEDAIRRISALADDGQQPVNIANILQDFSVNVGGQSSRIKGQIVTPVLESIERQLSESAEQLGKSSEDLIKNVSDITTRAQKLQDNVERLKSNIAAIEADPKSESKKYVGGTTVARLAAAETKGGVNDLGQFATRILSDADTYQSGLSRQTQSATSDLEKIIEALGKGEIDDVQTRLASLSDALSGQQQMLRNQPSPIAGADDAFHAAMGSLDEIEEAARKYVTNVSEMYGTSKTQTHLTDEERKARAKLRGYGIFGSPTKFALEQDVGIIERSLSAADLERVRGLTSEGRLNLPRDYDLQYYPGENTDTRWTGINGKKDNSQKFMEQVWRGVSEEKLGDQAFLNEGKSKIVEHTKTVLGRGDRDHLIEIWKHLASTYSSEVKGDTDRKLGIPKSIFDNFDSAKKDLAQSGQPDPFTLENYQLLKHMQGAQVELGANNFRRNWRRAWEDTINFRYNGDYKNELLDSSAAEYKSAMAWRYGTRLVKHKLWPIVNPVRAVWKNTIGDRYIKPIILDPTKGYRGRFLWGTVKGSEEGVRKFGLRTIPVSAFSLTTAGGVALQLPLIAGGAAEGLYEVWSGNDSDLDIWGRGTAMQLGWFDLTAGSVFRAATDSETHIGTDWTGQGIFGDRFEITETRARNALADFTLVNGEVQPITDGARGLDRHPSATAVIEHLADKDKELTRENIQAAFAEFGGGTVAAPAAGADGGGDRNRESGGGDRNRESGGGDRSRESGGGDRSRESGGGDRNRETSGGDRSREQQGDGSRSPYTERFNRRTGSDDWVAAGGNAVGGVVSGAFDWDGDGNVGGVLGNAGTFLSGGAQALFGFFGDLGSGRIAGGQTWAAAGIGIIGGLIGANILKGIIPGGDKIPFLGLILFGLIAGYGGKFAYQMMTGQGSGMFKPNGSGSTDRTNHEGDVEERYNPREPIVVSSNTPGEGDSVVAVDNMDGEWGLQVNADGETFAPDNFRQLTQSEVTDAIITQARRDQTFFDNDWLLEDFDEENEWRYNAVTHEDGDSIIVLEHTNAPSGAPSHYVLDIDG